MTSLVRILIIMTLVLLSSCNGGQSLQEYYVENSENSEFISIDVPASILNINEVDLDEEQKAALASFKKLNVLAFKLTDNNKDQFEAEQAKVSQILNGSKYNDLMSINSQGIKGSVKYLGNDEAIDEVVVFGKSNEHGFAVVRVLGDDMNPAQLVSLMQSLQKSDLDVSALEDFFN